MRTLIKIIIWHLGLVAMAVGMALIFPMSELIP